MRLSGHAAPLTAFLLFACFWPCAAEDSPPMRRFGRECFLHGGRILAMVCSSDGRLVVTGGADNRICVFDARDGTRLREMSGHTDRISCLALAPAGDLLASGTYNGEVKLWDPRSGALMESLPRAGGRGESDLVYGLAFSKDGKTLAIGRSISGYSGNKGLVRVQPARGGPEGRTYPIATEVLALAWAPDGTWLALGGRGALSRMSLPGGEVTRLTTGPGDWTPSALAFDHDGRRLAAGFGSRRGVIFAIGEPGRIELERPCPGDLNSLAFSPDGTTLLAGTGQRGYARPGYAQLCRWDAATGRLRAPLLSLLDTVTAVACSPDGKTVYAGGEDQIVHAVRASDGQEAVAVEGHSTGITDLACSPDGTLLATLGTDGAVNVWDWKSAKRLATTRDARGVAHAVALKPDGGVVVASASARAFTAERKPGIDVRLRDGRTGSPIRLLQSDDGPSVTSLALSSDGRLVAACGEDGPPSVWQVATGRPVHVDAPRADEVAFSDDGRVLICRYSSDVTLIDVETGRPVGSLELRTGPTGLSADRQPCAKGPGSPPVPAATASRGRGARWTRTVDRRLLDLLMVQGAKVSALAWSADGHSLAAGNDQGLAALLDLRTGAVRTWPAHESSVTALAFAPGDHALVSGGADTRLIVWTLTPR